MEQLTPGTLIAVFEEMFGKTLFWSLVVAAVVVLSLYLYVLVRDRRISWRKFLLAQLSMPLGALAAVHLVFAITHSSYADAGGPIDWLVLLGIAAAGAVAAAIFVYTLQSLIRGKPAERHS